jgi:hypothetical protein
MTDDRITYRQLDALLKRVGFTRERREPKWLRYHHAATNTEIILVEHEPGDFIRPSDAWSAREHLLRKGLVSEADFNALANSARKPENPTAPAATS